MEATLEALAVSMASAAVKHGNALIRAGRISESASWSGPSASAENTYLEEEGLADFGRWYMGRQSDAEPDTKAHFRYPFTDDFKTISENGLKAIRSRSAQNDETEIFNAAGKMLDSIAKKRGEMSAGGIQFRHHLQAGPGLADRDRGEMYDVNILTTGTARGHQMMISERTLGSAMTLLAGANLPAYLTHSDSAGDRLLTEAGIFSGFYLDGDRIKARQFTALDAFREYEPEKFDRLFEMASAAPELFGVSIVFEGRLFWETEEDDVDFSILTERPETARFSLPTVEPTAISSADFVDQPAANPSLFSALDVDARTLEDDLNMNANTATLSAESASHQPEAKAAAPAAAPAKKPAAVEEPKPKKKAPKKALAEPEEAPAPVEILEDEVSPELDASTPAPEPTAAEAEIAVDASAETEEVALDEEPNEIEELRAHIQALRDRISELEKLHVGPEPIEEADETPELTTAEQLRGLIDDYILANPKDSRSTAVLAVGKSHPELFNK